MIELVISIFILSIAVIGAYNAFTTMDILTSNSSDRFIGAYLAQEGMEIIRNIRDTNWLQEVDWYDGLAVCEDLGCEADYTTFKDSGHLLSVWADNYLRIDSDGFYNYENGDITKFRRKILITPLKTYTTNEGTPVYDTMKVEVVVYWIGKSNLLNSLLDFTPLTSIPAGEIIYDILWGIKVKDPLMNRIVVEEYLYNWY